MIEAQGTYFDGKSSKAHKATMRCSGDRLTIEEDGGPLLQGVRLSQCRLDPPLGKAGRSIRLPGGAVFETPDADALYRHREVMGKEQDDAVRPRHRVPLEDGRRLIRRDRPFRMALPYLRHPCSGQRDRFFTADRDQHRNQPAYDGCPGCPFFRAYGSQPRTD